MFDVTSFIKSLPKHKVHRFSYQALYKGEWYPVSRINKTKKTFALSHEGGELVVTHTEIEDVKDYLD
ncbi:hypothetical protein HKK70_09160 [Bacillus safensis]|uniref:hypothetical protein n=1 Tax=Bacillus safensis TaxID=561879 RepID=UPI00146C19A5|nr:hypothetical protein [Bacillus safensis]MCM3365938.1 hypothetical protein [Bacillus safensis]NMW01934.1 hypothetical protein [Bacillus safensis]